MSHRVAGVRHFSVLSFLMILAAASWLVAGGARADTPATAPAAGAAVAADSGQSAGQRGSQRRKNCRRGLDAGGPGRSLAG